MIFTQATMLILASIAAFGTAMIHLIVGGKYIAAPLLSADLHRVVKYTHYYCWHMVSMVLFMMALCFIAPFVAPSGIALAALSTLLAWLFAIWSLGLMIGTKSTIGELPQWTLFVAIALPGTASFFV